MTDENIKDCVTQHRIAGLEKALNLLELKADRMETALRLIAQWGDAYPLSVFPPADFARARELLEAGGMTLDRVSADCMRHVALGVSSIAKEALK